MKEILLAVWLASNCRRQLLLTYWWQIKEYRFDRFLVFLKTPEGRNKTGFWWFFLKISLFALTIAFPSFWFFFFAILAGETIVLLYEILFRQLRHPKITFRSLAFFLTFFLLAIFLVLVFWENPNFSFLFLADLAGYVTPWLASLWTGILLRTILKKKRLRALSILQEHKPIIIAITGSYGKSSTKHLLFELVKNYAPTVKTPASYNTPLGIIRAVKDIKQGTRYFICEMGAYKQGEITNLCKIARPDYAIITGIAPQHLALFGNMDNLIKAKYEIAQNLKPGGVLFINSSHQSANPLISMAKNDNLRVSTYALKQKDDQETDYLASIVKQDENATTFKMKLTDLTVGVSSPHASAERNPAEAENLRIHSFDFAQDFLRRRMKTPQSIEFTTNLTGRPLLENLTGALSVALSLKIPVAYLKKAVANLPQIDSGMQIIVCSPNITIIDDSYNSNPLGFEAALTVLSGLKGFRVVITDGIQELGKTGFMIHKKLGERLGFADLVLTTSPSLIKAFKAGLGQKCNNLYLIKQTSKTEKLKTLIKTPAVILIEGRLPLQLLNTIKNLS